MKRDQIGQIFARLRQQNPNPKTELRYASNFELLVAVILSAQATDVSVNKATATLFQHANTPAAMLELAEEGLKKHIRNIGLANTKAKNILKTCTILLRKHAGEVPNQRQELEALPGVGRKTANVILNTAFGQPTLAVDTHVFRLANRIPLATGKTTLEVERKLLRCIPSEFLQDAHHWLILHGRHLCTARNPRCNACVLWDLCSYKGKTAGGLET